jgi:hypothetical protein
METVKDPAMILSIINSVALAGNTFYFYKQLEAIRSDMQQITKTLNSIVTKFSEITKSDQNKHELITTLHGEVLRLDKSLKDLPVMEDVEVLNTDVDEIISALQQINIEIERPSEIQQVKPISARRDIWNSPRSDYRSSISSRNKVKPEPKNKPRSNSHEFDTDVNYGPASRSIAGNRNRNKHEPKVQTRPPSMELGSDGDDLALIEELRRSQARS